MTETEAYARMIRTERALSAATRAELEGAQLEPFEIQAADAWARYATIAGAQSPVLVSAP